MVTSFFQRLRRIDEIVAAGPQGTTTARALVSLLLEPASRKYFLDRLSDARWLTFLRDIGFFAELPAPVRRGDVVEHPIWPESMYLARVSALAPEAVCDIIVTMPDTDNIWVIDDLIKAASVMLPDAANNLLPRILCWLDKPLMPYTTQPLGELAARLAEGGQTDSALDLSRSLLRIELRSEGGLRDRVVPRRGVDTWQYEQVLTQSAPRIVASAGQPAFEMLCDLLDRAVSLSGTVAEGSSREDYSYMWHDAVESESHGTHGDVRNLLVCAVRDAGVRLVEERKMGATAVVRALESRKWPIFRRIALHVLRVIPHPPRSLLARRLLRRRPFDRLDPSGREHEYALLVRDGYARLSDAQKATILSWIAEGPDTALYTKRMTRFYGKSPSRADAREYVGHWRLDRLALLADHLPREWAMRYAKLRRQFGEPERLDAPRPRFGGGWVGSPSPKSAEGLNAMSVGEVVDYANGFQPEGHPMKPSIEGLERTLAAAVAADPDRYARAAGVLRKLDKSGFVFAVLDGFRGALEQKKRFPWPGVLDLCLWVVRRPVANEAEPAPEHIAGVGWRDARHAVAFLMDRALQHGTGLDIRLRERVWAAIEPVTSDLEPHEAQDEEETGSRRGWDTVPSTIRSTAVECAIRYAIWVYDRARKRAPDQSFDFSAVPEARAVLDHHADPRNDTSRAVRQVFGLFFPQLVMLDAEWARQNARLVFPHGDDRARLRSPAWNAYLKFCRPYTSVFAALAEEYRYAVETLPSRSAHEGGFGPSDDKLAEHVMVYYWWGKIGLENDSLVRQFFALASDKLRAHAIGFVGRSVGEWDRPIPDDVLRRLTDLWDWRTAEARSQPTSDRFAEELAAFGWWFISGKLPRKWTLAQLHAAIQLAGWTEPEQDVVEHLAAEMKTQPEVALDCVDRVFRTAVEREGWRADPLLKPAHAILEAAVRGPQVRTRALEMVNAFGAAGYIEQFRDLADEPGRE